MKTLRAAASLAALLILAGCDPETLFKGDKATNARKRAQLVLETVSREGESTSMEYQTAVCRWWKDKTVIHDMGEFSWAYDKFGEFKRQGSLTRGFQFQIEDAEEIEGSAGTEFLVRGTANGGRFELVVPDGKAMRWKKAPPPSYG